MYAQIQTLAQIYMKLHTPYILKNVYMTIWILGLGVGDESELCFSDVPLF